MDNETKKNLKGWQDLANIKRKYYEYEYPQKYEDDYEEDLRKQKEFQEVLKKIREFEKEATRRKNVCLLCGEEVPSHPMVCQDCKRVFAAFKSILVEEKAEEPPA